MYNKQAGATLVEMAIVLLLISLILGAVLRGQELISSARVRNAISQSEGIKAALYSFQDRFHALPGDYALASANIANVPAFSDGNSDGKIDGGTESVAVWLHLSRAGFLNGAYTMASAAESPSQANSPMNAFGGVMQLADDAVFTGATGPRMNLKTGRMPATVAAEIDRKVDDGNPNTGRFRFSAFAGASAEQCVNGEAWTTADEPGCGGAYLF